MINFLVYHGLGVLRFVNFVLWLFLALKFKYRNLNRFVVYGFTMILGIFTIWDILMIVTNRSGEIYLFFWTVISISEFYVFIYTFFKMVKLNLDNYFPLIIIFVSIPIIFTTILSFFYKSYIFLNKVDFISILILAIIGAINLRFILFTKKFVDFSESFLIFSGFILYFGLQILTSNSAMFNFLGSWYIAQNATLISLLFWIGSALLVWKLRSKLPS